MCICTNAKAVEAHHLWLFEQALTHQRQDSKDEARHFLSLSGTNYLDNLSLQLNGVVSLSDIQIAMLVSERLLADSGRTPPDGRRLFTHEKRTVGFEIAREYISSQGHYGRLGMGALSFFPLSSYWLRVALNAGLRLSSDSDWEFRFQGNFLRNFNDAVSIINVGGEISKQVLGSGTSRLLLGGAVQWYYQQRINAVPVGTPKPYSLTFEHMLFAIEPALTWKSEWMLLRLGLDLRLFLDKELFASSVSSPDSVGYPSGVYPGLNVRWVLVL